jgi:hypothetical protein
MATPGELSGRHVEVDGYNVLLTVEAALSGAVLLLARDGCLRDLASMSGHFKRVECTRQAIDLVANWLDLEACASVRWLLDRPVSNSARLRNLIEEVTAGCDASWEVLLEERVDRRLMDCGEIVATADSAILDRCGRWVNLARLVVDSKVPDPWILDLSAGPPEEVV